MASNNIETEAKFYVQDLVAVENRLLARGAVIKVPRTFEYNLRFDTQNKRLQGQKKVLRLRKYDDVRLTFKGPGTQVDGALSRTEIELVVNDFDSAWIFLEALGYHVWAVYEKYRAMYSLDSALITLDELPFGNFVEIEAENPNDISKLAGQLGLNSAAMIATSYQGLFERVKKELFLQARNLAFREFTNIHLTAGDLGVQIADS